MGRADIYSLGAMLYQMVTGRPPFAGTDPLTIAFQQVHIPPQPPRRLNPELPDEWNRLILAMLAKNPARRPQTAEAVRMALASLDRGSTQRLPAQTPTDHRAMARRDGHREPMPAPRSIQVTRTGRRTRVLLSVVGAFAPAAGGSIPWG